jgi:hypothetical protein
MTQRTEIGAARSGFVTALALVATLGGGAAQADDAQARQIFQAMSDYLGAQKTIAFDFDSSLEIVTTEGQKLALASSGRVELQRPDKLYAHRTGGFASVEAAFDGTTLTLLNEAAGRYAEIAAPGTVEEVIDALRDDLGRPMPAADLLFADVAAELMPLVTDAKDLGSGLIRGVECDHLAFRTPDADWQIWIAQGDAPYPCRYIITSRDVTGWPQYTIDVRDWQAGAEATHGFALTIPAGAKKVEPADLPDFDDIAGIYGHEGTN